MKCMILWSWMEGERGGGREGWDFCKKIVAGGKKNWRKGKEEKQGKTL